MVRPKTYLYHYSEKKDLEDQKIYKTLHAPIMLKNVHRHLKLEDLIGVFISENKVPPFYVDYPLHSKYQKELIGITNGRFVKFTK